MSRQGFPILLLLSFLAASPALAQPPDLTYHTVTPCVLVDTRTTGGAFTPGETRTYNVAGSCGVPAWSNNVAQAQAVALTITAISPTWGGHIKAYAADQTTGTSVLNFTTNVNVANTTPVALAQTPGVGDIKINVTLNTSGSTAHVLLTVVGYYSRDMQTIHVHPVPGDEPASGTRLINAIASITDAAATKHYVVKVEPGIYDVGSTMLVMKPYVDIEGSGQQATVIKGVGNNDDTLLTGVVKGASSSELRDLQVQSVGSSPSQPASIAVLVHQADTSIRDVTILATGVSTWGIRNVNSPSSIEGVTITSQASSHGYGIGNKFILSTPTIKRTVIRVTAGTAYGISSLNGASPKEVRDVEIDVSGTGQVVGFFVDNYGVGSPSSRITDSTITSSLIGVYFRGDTLDIEHSQIRAAETGIYNNVNTVRVKSSEVSGATSTIVAWNLEVGATLLDGGPVDGIFSETCAGVYDEAFTFYASTCP